MSSSDLKSLCQYRYDALDRLIGHVLPNTPQWNSFYCHALLATKLQGTTSYSIFQSNVFLLGQQKSQIDTSETLLFSTDQQRSTIQILRTKNTSPPLAYAPYGYCNSASRLDTILGFNSECPDSLTQHYPLGQGHRTFNPILMRFHSPDTLSPFDRGGLNPYAYCLGDPINRIDPNGQFSFATVGRALLNTLDTLIIRPLSFVAFGAVSKPIQNYQKIAKGVAVFDDTYKKGSRLNIIAHGNIDPRNNASYMVADNKYTSPKQLTSLLQQRNINTADYKSIRLLICDSADGTYSFASEVANLSQKPVKAFSNSIAAAPLPSFRKPRTIGSIDKSANRILVYKGGIFNKFTRIYQPKKFDPISAIRQPLS